MRSHTSCLVVFALALGLPAQTIVTPWPGGTFDTAITGTLLGGVRRCALVERSGLLSLVFDIGHFRSIAAVNSVPALTGVTGFCAYRPGGLSESAGDVLVIATSTGVWRGAFAPDSGESKLFCAPYLDATWNGARLLKARTLSNGDVMIAARSAAGDYALIATEHNGATSSQDAWHSVNTVTGVHLFDWDHDGDIDPVVATTAGTGMTAVNGELVIGCNANLASARTLPVKFGGNDELGLIWNGLAYPRQSIVWGALNCTQLARADLPTSGLSAVGQLTTGAATFDVNADGISEVLVSRAGDFKYVQQSSNGLFGIINVVAGATGNPANNQCPFFWDDFDDDGQPDLLAFWNQGITDSFGAQTKAMLFHSNMLSTPGSAQPPGGSARANFHYIGAILDSASYDSSTHSLQVTLNGGYQAESRAVRVTVWRQPNPFNDTSLNATYRDPTPPLDAQAVERKIDFGPGDPTSPEPITVGSQQEFDSGYHYYADIRLYDVNTKEVLLNEVDGFRIFPQGAESAYLAAHNGRPDGYLDFMLRYLLEKRGTSASYTLPLEPFVAPDGLPPGGIVILDTPPPPPIEIPFFI